VRDLLMMPASGGVSLYVSVHHPTFGGRPDDGGTDRRTGGDRQE
jgi:hypothetical protein